MRIERYPDFEISNMAQNWHRLFNIKTSPINVHKMVSECHIDISYHVNTKPIIRAFVTLDPETIHV